MLGEGATTHDATFGLGKLSLPSLKPTLFYPDKITATQTSVKGVSGASNQYVPTCKCALS